MAQHPVPVMVLARLAVDLPHQGMGLGTALLKDALFYFHFDKTSIIQGQ